MKTKFIFLSLLIALAGFAPMQILAQQDEDLRGAFLTTRPKAAPRSNKPAATAKPRRRRPKSVTPSPGPGPVVKKDDRKVTPEKVNISRLGLGLTLFMRNSNGLAVRTEPSHEFRMNRDRKST